MKITFPSSSRTFRIHQRKSNDVKLSKRQVAAVEARLRRCKLEMHPDKTHVVYCRDSNNRQQDHEHIQFDFLGYTFRPRGARNRRRELFCGFMPAISAKASKAIVAEVRSWNLHRRSDKVLSELARMDNVKIRGWLNYYGRYYPSALHQTFRHLNRRLVRWARKKYKRFRDHERRAWRWLRQVARSANGLFAHWQLGITP